MTVDVELSVVSYFINNPTASMIEISENTGISKSSVQRILNKSEYSNIIIKSTGNTIKEQLELNKLNGKRKGGRNYFQNNESIKDESGKFAGSKFVEADVDNEAEKQSDIKLIVEYFLYNPNNTMEQIANFLNQEHNKKYTKSYVYDCLLDNRVEELYGPIVKKTIKEQLSYNQQSFYKKFGFLSIDLQTLSLYNLTDEEISLLLYRFNNGDLRTTEETAKHFNCSRTVIEKVENRIMNIINSKNNEEGQKRI